MTRIFSALAIALLLSGCATSDGGVDEAAFQMNASADDAHCQSLLMRPGDLVYAQCRLALRKTYLNDYAARKKVIEAKYGPIDHALDLALRNDAFCNYDQSTQMVLKQMSDQAVAEAAYGNCSDRRNELDAEFTKAKGVPGETLNAMERPMIIRQNIQAVQEAKDVING
ncbi:hypothetical protein [Jiella sp. M17.18]|uniref:hypothetical protein n=1 Tax=Jiella sp. M17.18 TaxID=3234247 RepID=UPI0034DE34B9